MSDLGLSLRSCRLYVRDVNILTDFYSKTFGMKTMFTYTDPETNEAITLLGYPTNSPNKTRLSDDQEQTEIPKVKGQGSCFQVETSNLLSGTYLELILESQKGGDITRVNCEGERSCYWKIGINLYDLDAAVSRLRSAGVRVSEPLQIPNVGNLCHVYDPEGYDTEIMQFTLTEPLLPHTKHEMSTIGQEAVFSVITLRVKDMEKSLRFYCGVLGLQPVCRQDQTEYGFDIYYLSCQHVNTPPNKDIEALENVEWTYQQPYTLLELVANTKEGKEALSYQELSSGQCGFKGLRMHCTDVTLLKQKLQDQGIVFTEQQKWNNKATLVVKDPDCIPIEFSSN